MSCLLLIPQHHPSYQTTKHHTTPTVAIPLLTSPAAAPVSSSSHDGHLAAWHLKDQQCNALMTPGQHQ
eukprot:8615360-Ditylum_brightwellii.AAC.1